MDPIRHPWHPIERLQSDLTASNGSFAALEALRAEWEGFLASLTPEEVVGIRQRSLRLLAVETGLIERLYDIEWGLTLTLASEGFARDVIERSGGAVDEHTRATLLAQRDSLEMVREFVGSDRQLTPGFVKELHSAITRTQGTYPATDALGRQVDVDLKHGEYKTAPNHVQLADNSVLEYTPPEHVASEVDRLVQLHRENESAGVHPIVCAAWLHHRFVQIHPFADGNGRVARGLVLLVLLQHRYAPLVVDRFHRNDYLQALDAANLGDLTPLVRLFTRLENAALTRELEAPASQPVGTSTEVAHTLAAQLSALRAKQQFAVDQALGVRATAINARVKHWFETKRSELERTLAGQGIADGHVLCGSSFGPEHANSHWWRHQIITSARRAGHFADTSRITGWHHLRVRVGGVQLRFLAALHGAGKHSGVLAVVTVAELEPIQEDDGTQGSMSKQLIETTRDAFRVVHTEATDSIEARSKELEELLDEGLTIGLVRLFEGAV